MIGFVDRLLLVSLFLWSGLYNKPVHFNRVSGKIAEIGLPFPRLLCAGAAGFEVLASLQVLFPNLLGFPHLFAFALGALAVYTIITAVLFHPFWVYSGPERDGHLVNFLKNVSLTGALLMLVHRHGGL